jgi:hypothetical protein
MAQLFLANQMSNRSARPLPVQSQHEPSQQTVVADASAYARQLANEMVTETSDSKSNRY